MVGMRRRSISLIVVLAALGFTCDRGPRPENSQHATPSRVTRYSIEVIRRFPHDPTAYTQGLVYRDGYLYESTGRYGHSDLRKLDPATGAILMSTKADPDIFAEGLASTASHLVQLSWKEFQATYYDPKTLAREKTVEYTGEGWGLCFDGTSFYMTSGDDQLIRRDADTFAALSSTSVTMDGAPLAAMNELECVGDGIWANIYLTSSIVRIDKTTGVVTGAIDASSIIPPGIPNDADHVLNGIAYNATSDTYYLTGKLWPWMLEVRIK
jgi:glutaminyl-peptide cyclotransferase